MAQMEKKSPKKRLADEQAETEGKKINTPGLEPLPGTPSVFRKVVKHNIRSIPQLKFDIKVTKLLVSCGLPFKVVKKRVSMLLSNIWIPNSLSRTIVHS